MKRVTPLPFVMVLAAALLLAGPVQLAAAEDGEPPLSDPAEAAPPDAGMFGIGPMLGDPMGASMEWMADDYFALDLGVGFGLIDDDHFVVQFDAVWLFLLGQFETGQLDFRLGVGPRLGLFVKGDPLDFGWHVPIGIDWRFSTTPIDVFLDVAPGMWLIRDVQFDIDATIGLRFWF